MRILTAIALLLVLALPGWAQESTTPTAPEGVPTETVPDAEPLEVTMKTSMGDVVLELYPDKAPLTVANFVDYATTDFYDGTVFHRIVPGFVIQGGGFTPELNKKKTKSPIVNEAQNGLSNERGTIAMARTQYPNTATSQFFINLKDNEMLDFKAEQQGGYGYAVFGRVVEGMEVVDAIASVPTTTKGRYQNVPVEPVVIEDVVITE
jgi:cyclophilin family peptidyl-prolyl cis-trans isomerase